MELLYYSGVVVALLFFSAAFSGSESAYFSVSPWRLKRLSKEGRSYAISASRLLEKPERLLVTILIGNEIINALFAQTGAIINRRINPDYITVITIAATALSVSLLVIFGEITPKSLAIRRPMRFVRFTRFLLVFWWKVTTPLSAPVEKLLGKILSRKDLRESTGTYTTDYKDEMKRFITLGTYEGIIDMEEELLLRNIIQLDSLGVKDVITPRHMIAAVEVTKTSTDAITAMKKSGHSRLIVFNRDLDDVIGKISLRDLIPELKKSKRESKALTRFIRPVLNVPEHINLKALLSEMQRRKENMAVVFDEYGGTVGLVTLEDIVEEIVGDIRDESDLEKQPVKKTGKNIYTTNAKILLRDLAREISFPVKTQFSALHGYLVDIFGTIPDAGDVIEDKHYQYKILSVSKQRIGDVEIKPVTRSNKTRSSRGGAK